MIEENGRSRVYLGVHWVFDAFAVKATTLPTSHKKVDGKFVGGVPLGLSDRGGRFQPRQREGAATFDGRPRAATLALTETTETFSSSYLPAAQAK